MYILVFAAIMAMVAVLLFVLLGRMIRITDSEQQIIDNISKKTDSKSNLPMKQNQHQEEHYHIGNHPPGSIIQGGM